MVAISERFRRRWERERERREIAELERLAVMLLVIIGSRPDGLPL